MKRIKGKKLETPEDALEELIKDTGNFNIKDNSQKPGFIINTIMYVSGEESETSSDEEYNERWGKYLEKFDENDKYKFPYSTFRIETTKTKKGKDKDKIIKFNGFVSEKVKLLSNSEKNTIQVKKTSVGDFLEILHTSGLKGIDRENIKDTLAASICLNRPLSLSTRKNNLLKKEFKASSETALITHDKFALYWSIPWHDREGNLVEYDKVKGFYKKLKRFDKDHNTEKAEQFRKACEDGISVPYQELRELAKNHPYTAKLEKLLRTKSADVYLSIIDGDTISFNGIYSAYTKIYNQSKTSPTIMSTGYEFQENNAKDKPFVECAKLDRLIRIETAKYFPLGTYYPEPNLCILIEPNLNSVMESFIDKKRGEGISLESPILISNILASRGPDIVCIFSEEDPLITAIPYRFRLTKNRKALLKFSKGFVEEGRISAEDFRQFDQIGQSKTNGREYAKALYYNKGFTLKGARGITGKFNGIVDSLFACNKNEENTYIKKLKEIILSNEENKKGIIKAILASKSVKLEYKRKHVLSDDFRKYLKEELKCQITDYNQQFLNIISKAEITDLFREEILDLNELYKFFLDISQYSSTIFQKIMYNPEIIEMLENEWITTEDIMKFCNTVVRHKEDLSDSIDQLITVINNGIYDTDDIIESYSQNKLHLLFMASEDHTDLVIENSEDEEIVKFALKYYSDELDLEWIKDQLPKSARMDFSVLIGEYEDYNEDSDENVEEEGCTYEWLNQFPDSDDKAKNTEFAATEYDIINDDRPYTALTDLINQWKPLHVNSPLCELLEEGAEIIRRLSYEKDSKIITDLQNKKAKILKQINNNLVAQDDILNYIINIIEGYTFISQADNTPTYSILWETINEDFLPDFDHIREEQNNSQ